MKEPVFENEKERENYMLNNKVALNFKTKKIEKA